MDQGRRLSKESQKKVSIIRDEHRAEQKKLGGVPEHLRATRMVRIRMTTIRVPSRKTKAQKKSGRKGRSAKR